MSELTFAEAMALEPSEVEFCYAPGPNGQNWSPLEAGMDQSLHGMRHAKFRRAKPKRSRVQEMAESGQCGRSNSDVMTTAIRAACEWLRSKSTDLHEFKDVAPYIEHEFLVPR